MNSEQVGKLPGQVDKLRAMRAIPELANHIIKPAARFAYWMEKLGLKNISELKRYLAAIHNTTTEEVGETLDSISEVLRADWEQQEVARTPPPPTVILIGSAQPLEGDPRAPAEPTQSKLDAENQPGGISWQDVAERMKRLRTQGEPWTSQHKLAKLFGCSSGAINKAIRGTPELRAWAKRQTSGAPIAQSLTDMVTDCTPQTREPDPADEAAIREYIENADPETRAWFLALAVEKQLEIVNDPDKHQRILGPRL